jgi:hypothetical protein
VGKATQDRLSVGQTQQHDHDAAAVGATRTASVCSMFITDMPGVTLTI